MLGLLMLGIWAVISWYGCEKVYPWLQDKMVNYFESTKKGNN